ncbi:MAG: hypothetical protein ABI651_14470 [Verrucomicrobiota bacterium]
MPEGFVPSHPPSLVAVPLASPSEPPELRHPKDQDNSASQSAAPTLFQANLLVAMLGGFWGRKADGHPGPDLLGRGLVLLATLDWWE